MPVYELLLSIGVIGYLALMAMGLVHGHAGGHHSHDGGGAHADHGVHIDHGTHIDHGVHVDHGAHAGHAVHGHHAAVDKGLRVATPPKSANQARTPRLWISPLDIFSLCMGGGLTGLVLRPTLANPILAICAALGAIVFCYLLIKPFSRFLLGFASRPSAGLEASIAQTATADSNFDETGKGLVRLVLEGEITRLLATLPPEERATRVLKGQELTILEVDSKKGTCVVTTLLNSKPYSTSDSLNP